MEKHLRNAGFEICLEGREYLFAVMMKAFIDFPRNLIISRQACENLAVRFLDESMEG